MSKRNKKYNPRKHADKMAQNWLKDKVVFYIKNSPEPQPIQLLNLSGNALGVTAKESDLIKNSRHLWSVVTCVFGYEKNGKQRIQKELHSVSSPLFQRDLVDYLNDQHQQFIKEFNQHNTAIGAAWLASPVGLDFDDEWIDNLLIKQGAFDYALCEE